MLQLKNNNFLKRDAPHGMSSGKCKLKEQWDTTTHLSECPKPDIHQMWMSLTTPNADKKVEQQELSFITSVNATWSGHFEDNLVVCYKTKHALTIHTIQQVHSSVFTQKSWNLCLQKPTHRCFQHFYSKLPKPESNQNVLEITK